MYIERLTGAHTQSDVIVSTERRVFEFAVDTCHTHRVYMMTSRDDPTSLAFELRLSHTYNAVSLHDALVRFNTIRH